MHHSIDYLPQVGEELVIRIAHGNLSFAKRNKKDGQAVYERYELNGSISMAANLRKAFQTSDFLKDAGEQVLVLVDSNVLLVPESEFQAEQIDTLYEHTFSDADSDVRMFDELPELSAVALYAIGKELKAAIEERFGDVHYMAIGTPVWKYFHHLHYTGHQKKLFGYFHDKKLEVFAFSQKRFKFCNSYTVSHVNDALYFLLFVWEQLALDQENDELYVAGDVPGEEWLTGQLRRYVQRVSVVPSGSGQMPYDLSLLCREIQKH